jgi:hypothetical protein
VTEAQWLTSTDPQSMLEFLSGRVTERKLRLFVCACVRRHWDALNDDCSRRAVEVAERFADGLADEVERMDVWGEAAAVRLPCPLTAAAVCAVESEDAYWTKVDLVRDAAEAIVRVTPASWSEHAVQCALLRCIFGPRPFATPPRIADVIRIWGDRTVPKLARTIYDEHAFDLLPILADALEEAGCTDQAILDHLRDPGAHGRGCFALDSCLLP